MASLRDIRKRIRSVKSTQKITRAMKLVSAAKLRRAQQAIVAARPYANGLHTMISRIAKKTSPEGHPLLARPEQIKRVMVIVVSSDRGMCGAFNSSVIKKTLQVLSEGKTQYDVIELGTIGRRGRDFMRKRPGVTIRREYPGVFENLNFGTAKRIADELAQEFVAQDLDAIYLVYNEFKSAISQTVLVEQLLPIQPAEGVQDDLDYIYEPERDALLEKLLPRYLATQVWRALLESQASEHGARMSAMESATKNAGEMIGNLTLVYNRARQAAITKELMEIISGSEAQKG